MKDLIKITKIPPLDNRAVSAIQVEVDGDGTDLKQAFALLAQELLAEGVISQKYISPHLFALITAIKIATKQRIDNTEEN